MGGSRTNPYVLRMQASRQKPNYEKGLKWKGSCGFHIGNKYAKKTDSHANRYQGQISACDEGKQEISRPSTPTDGFVNEESRCL
jgi:hypothetical protein